MTVEHDIAMRDLTRKVDEFIRIFGKEDFQKRYQAWSQKHQIKIGWTCLPTALSNRLHDALERAIAAVPSEAVSAAQNPKSTRTKRKQKAEPVEIKRDLPPPATSELEMGTW